MSLLSKQFQLLNSYYFYEWFPGNTFTREHFFLKLCNYYSGVEKSSYILVS